MNVAVQQEKYMATFEYAVFISAMHGSHCPLYENFAVCYLS
jgi:hypothetical protein